MKTDDFSLRDNAEVDEDPPYMVIKTKENPKDNGKSEITSPQQRFPGRGDVFSMGLQLGEEYEKKKQKLQQELRLDFRRYVSKKTDLKSYPSTQPESLSLLFDERKSMKDKLRDERKKEYNLFLKEQAGLKSAVSKRQSSISYKSSPSGDNTDTPSRYGGPSPVLVPDHQHADAGFHNDDDQPPAARRGPSAPTEEDADGTPPVRRRRRWEKGRGTRESPVVVVLRGGDYESRRPTRRQRRRGRRQGGRRGRTGYSSEEDEDEDVEEEELTSSHEEEEMERGWKGRPRSKQEAPVVAPHQDSRTGGILKPQSATANINRPAADTIAMRSAERARSATNRPQAEVATGLAIGAEEGSQASQKKKELYRLELLEQMAEKQRNKRREKELEMRVAATGAVDPEKEPDRIAQFGAANLPYGSLGRSPPRGDQRITPRAEAAENMPPPGKPRVAFSIPGSGPPRAMQTSGAIAPQLPLSTEDFHRTMSRALGEMATPRPVGLGPPIPPPALTDTYRTPYDEAYLYYGARHPLDPNLHHYDPAVGGGAGGGEVGGYQPVGVFSPPRGAPPLGTPQNPGVSSQHAPVSPAVLGVLPEQRPGQTRESTLSYGDALRQQIKESRECRTREREEKDRYHAKIEEEMKAYDPWGRGGAGAPIRDKGGNLISDLNKMRRTNENAYMNSEGGDRTEAETSPQNASSPKTEDATFDQPEHQRPGVPAGVAPHFARSKVFQEEPAPRKLLEQKDYRHFLELQMEEKRRKQAEEQEEARLEEEKLERRLVEEQAQMQREFQQEQEKKRRERVEQSRSNAVLMLQAEERRRQAESRRRDEEQERANETRPPSRRERERQEGVARRGASPLVPTLQRRLGRQTAPPGPPTPPSRPPSSSASATQSERSTPAPYSPPVPARRNQLRAREDRQEVIRELSVLRRHLSAERRRVELLAQREETPAPPPRPPRYRKAPETEVLEAVRRAGRAPSAGARVTMLNIRDFNRLRDRDTASRAEVRCAYPDPPRDEVSLDIQQRALLRMQRRRTGPPPTGPAGGDGLIDPLRQLHRARKPREQTEASLASDGEFLDCCGADPSPDPPQRTTTPPPPPPPPPPSAGRRGRTPSDRAERSQNSTTPLPADPPPARRTPAEAASPSEEQTPPPRGSAPPRRPASQEEELPGSPVEEEEAGGERSQAPSRVSLVSENMRRIQARNQQRLRQLDRLGLDPELLSEVTSGDDGGSTPLTARSRVSRETVATEPWLRPGTSESVKRLSRRDTERQGGGGARAQDQEWLDGPNTYHG